MLPSCSAEYILHSWSCPDRLKSYHMSHLLLDLLKGLLLKAPLEIVLLSCYLIERAHKLIITWNTHSPESHEV